MKLNQNFILHTLADKTVVIPTDGDDSKIITLNESAKFIWEKLEEGADKETLVSSLAEFYSIETERAEKSVTAFLQKVKEMGFLNEA